MTKRLSVWRLLIEVSRFGRFSVLGFSLLLPLLGAAAVSRTLSGGQLAALAAVGFAFHVFGYVSNDVFDLAIDRTQPLRAGSPLVRGLVRPSVAMAIALIPVPLVSVVHLALGYSPTASAVLMGGMVLGLVYNAYGKRIPLPLLSDAIQGLAWVALTLYGALTVAKPLTPVAGWLAATVVVYVMYVNGLHGGLRDVANDAKHGAQTTALWLGARSGDDGGLILSRGVIVYGLVLQSLILLFASACVVGNWPEENRIPVLLMIAALIGGHLILLWLATVTLRAEGREEMMRAGMAHLFLSIGVVCLPFAFFTNAFATFVIVAAYAVPLVILTCYLTVHWMRMRSAVAASLLVIAVTGLYAEDVRVVPKEEIIRAMRAQKDKGYVLTATPNGARFNAGVLLDVANAADQRDETNMPIVLDHRDYYEAFLTVNALTPERAPTFIRIANEYGEDQYIDYRRQNVLSSVSGRQPRFAVNVVAGWRGGKPKYSYEDRQSVPNLRVTHERITSYRLLEFDDGTILFDDIQGIFGRVTTGPLSLLFTFFGDGQAVRSYVAIAPDGTQVALTTGRKWPFRPITTAAHVTPDGHGKKNVPPHLNSIKRRLENDDFQAVYVELRRDAPFLWQRITQ